MQNTLALDIHPNFKILSVQLQENFPDYQIKQITENEFLISKGSVKLVIALEVIEDSTYLSFEVAYECVENFDEYFAESNLISAFIYPKDEPLDFVTLKFPYETENDVKVFNNLAEVIFRNHFNHVEKFFEEVFAQMFVYNFKITAICSGVSAAGFVAFNELLKEYNLDSLFLLGAFHLLLTATSIFAAKKLFYKLKLKD